MEGTWSVCGVRGACGGCEECVRGVCGTVCGV